MHFEAREIERHRYGRHRSADGGEARTRNEERRRGKPKPQGQKRAAAYKTGYRHGDGGALPQKARGAVSRKPKAEQSCCRERDGDVAGEHEDRVELREERAVHEGVPSVKSSATNPHKGLAFSAVHSVSMSLPFAPSRFPPFYTRKPPVRTGQGVRSYNRWSLEGRRDRRCPLGRA